MHAHQLPLTCIGHRTQREETKVPKVTPSGSLECALFGIRTFVDIIKIRILRHGHPGLGSVLLRTSLPQLREDLTPVPPGVKRTQDRYSQVEAPISPRGPGLRLSCLAAWGRGHPSEHLAGHTRSHTCPQGQLGGWTGAAAKGWGMSLSSGRRLGATGPWTAWSPELLLLPALQWGQIPTALPPANRPGHPKGHPAHKPSSLGWAEGEEARVAEVTAPGQGNLSPTRRRLISV